MDEMQEKLLKIQKEIEDSVKVISEKTGKKIEFKAEYNESYLKINGKKIDFIMIGGLRTYVAGMYEITKDL